MSICSVHQNWAQAALSGTGDGPVCLVVVAEVRGSAPREAGAMMLVYKTHIQGSIGGGELEFQAIDTARKHAPEAAFARQLRSYPLGPALGQCCGGNVKLMFEWYEGPDSRAVLNCIAGKTDGYSQHRLTTQDSPTADAINASDQKAEQIAEPVLTLPLSPPQYDVFLYGAGHVGRAVTEFAQHLPCQIYWVDVDDDRYPEIIPNGIIKLPARQPQTIAQRASDHAIHLVMTYSHQLDFNIISTLLHAGTFARCGLIGSQTKATRFRKRLQQSEVSATAIDRLICPVGLPEITGKKPLQIALSVTAQLSNWLDAEQA